MARKVSPNNSPSSRTSSRTVEVSLLHGQLPEEEHARARHPVRIESHLSRPQCWQRLCHPRTILASYRHLQRYGYTEGRAGGWLWCLRSAPRSRDVCHESWFQGISRCRHAEDHHRLVAAQQHPTRVRRVAMSQLIGLAWGAMSGFLMRVALKMGAPHAKRAAPAMARGLRESWPSPRSSAWHSFATMCCELSRRDSRPFLAFHVMGFLAPLLPQFVRWTRRQLFEEDLGGAGE